jgi:hypothetical protein
MPSSQPEIRYSLDDMANLDLQEIPVVTLTMPKSTLSAAEGTQHSSKTLWCFSLLEITRLFSSQRSSLTYRHRDRRDGAQCFYNKEATGVRPSSDAVPRFLGYWCFRPMVLEMCKR